MPRPWKTPRRRRRRLRRLGIPERVSDRPRFELKRSIRTVSLAEMNQAESRIGAADIAHETDLRFLETLESFAVQLEADDDLLLEDDGVADPDDLGIGTSETDLELDEDLLEDEALDEVVLDEDGLDEVVLDDDDEDSLDPDTPEILQAVERTFEELDIVEEERETADGEAPAVNGDEEPFDPSAPDTFGESVEAHSLQSWDGTSLEEYLERSSELGMASWDGDSLDEYLGPGSDASLDPADEAHDPLGVGRGLGAPASGARQVVEPTDELDDLALDLEGTEDDLDGPAPREDGGIDPPLIGDLGPTPPAPVPRAGSAAAPDGPADLSADSIEVNSHDELIVQMGAGLDDAFTAEPLALVLEGEDDVGELSVGPVDDLSTGLAIPPSASLAALSRGQVEPPVPGDGDGDEDGAATTGGGKKGKGRGGDR